jgi:cytoskeletal protein CcmA (bactofilin family)
MEANTAPTQDPATPEPPAPEALKPQVDDSDSQPAETNSAKDADANTSAAAPATPLANKRLRRHYRPSHKATFIGLAVVVVILAVNVGIISFVIKSQSKSKDKQISQEQVTISEGSLDKLGVNRASVGNAGIELTVNPDARFKGKMQVGGDVSIAGQLKLNSKFSASDASLAKLEAGDTSLNQLNVNGDGTVSNLNLRKDLVVTGLSRLQGAVTVSQLFTVNNNANISGNLAVGGTLSVNNFHTSSLVSDSTITIGGHVITRGAAPAVGPGSALGANGSVSISGNDASGTVAANIGTGASSGIIANVAFRSQYGSIPHVIVTAIGAGVGSVYATRTIGGFSIGVNGPLAPGGYAFDYIVQQ